jgi:putative restriction endonuclease
LHAFGQYQSDLNLLGAVAHDPYAPNDAEIEIVDVQRQTTIRSVRQSLRSSNFRARVLSAYDHQCAFCGVQLSLVQAAHILPVSHEAGTDETFNGIASCYLHHAAYDRALITFDQTYHIHLNETQFAEFMKMNRGGGADRFRENLHPIIELPADKTLRPHVGYIEIANNLRGWDL